MVTITTVKMKDGSEKVKVESPYHPDFPKHAKNLGGKWNGEKKAWYFDPRDEASVRDLCLDLFGTDGRVEAELCDVHVKLSGRSDQRIWFAGREIAKRPGRDSKVYLGENVVLVEGHFSARGGSSKYPTVLNSGQSVTLEVRDIPVSLALREKEESPDSVTILSDEDMVEPITVVIAGEAAKALKQLGDDYSEIVASLILENAD